MILMDYILLFLAFVATIAGIFSNPRDSRIGVWAAIIVGVVAFGTLVASAKSIKSASEGREALQSSLSRIEALNEARGEQLDDARTSLLTVESALSQANRRINGLELQNFKLMERLQVAQDNLAGMAAPDIEVRLPRFSAGCERCEGELELVNVGGSISSVNELDVIAIGRVRLASSNEVEGCLFRPTPLFGGNPQEFERRFNLEFGLRYSHAGEEDVPFGGTAASIDVGVLLERINALILDVSEEHLRSQGELSGSRSDALSLTGCILKSARVSVRIKYSAANGAQAQRTYTYSLVNNRIDWKLNPLSGDIPMTHFGQLAEEDTHKGISEHLESMESSSREYAFEILVDFMAERRISN